MKNILKELWNGRISPFEEFGVDTEAYQERRYWLIKAEDALTAQLDEKCKELFEQYDQCRVALDRIAHELIFAKGFRLGVQLVLAALSET